MGLPNLFHILDVYSCCTVEFLHLCKDIGFARKKLHIRELLDWWLNPKCILKGSRTQSFDFNIILNKLFFVYIFIDLYQRSFPRKFAKSCEVWLPATTLKPQPPNLSELWEVGREEDQDNNIDEGLPAGNPQQIGMVFLGQEKKNIFMLLMQNAMNQSTRSALGTEKCIRERTSLWMFTAMAMETRGLASQSAVL